MWDKIVELAAQYGPFPLGIVVGISIKKWAFSKVLKLYEREKEALRQEKRELIELVKAKDVRIEKLHDKLFLLPDK